MTEFFISYENDAAITTLRNGAKEPAEEGFLPPVIHAETLKQAVHIWISRQSGEAFSGDSEITLDVLSEGVISVVSVERDWDPVYYISEPKPLETQPARRSACRGEAHSNGFVDYCGICLNRERGSKK